MELPKKRIPASTVSPRRLLLYSLPKTGKTTAIAKLDDCLIIDLEHGTAFVDSMHVKANNSAELREIVDALEAEMKKTGKVPYKYIAIDTATKLEEFADEIAPNLFKQTSLGSKFKGDIVELKMLPQGLGYKFVRDAYALLINSIAPLCERLILIGHTKDKYVQKEDKEATSIEVDLTGKLSKLVTQNVDAIGYVYRKKNQLFVSFKTDGQIVSGNRSPHLDGKDILLAESSKETGEVKAFWDDIFID
jgi:hypothetical protein